MRRLIVAAIVLALGPRLAAQNLPGAAAPPAPKDAFALADQETDWRVDFDGVTLSDWRATGEVKIKDGMLILGGTRSAKLQLNKLLGPRFKVFLECRVDGPVMPTIAFTTRGILSGGATSSSLHAHAGSWADVLLVGRTNERDMLLIDEYRRRAGTPPDRRGGFGIGGAPLLSLEIPAGTTLSIRKIRVQRPPPGDTTQSLFLGLGALMGAVTLIVAVGWLLQRWRRPRVAAPSAPPPPA